MDSEKTAFLKEVLLVVDGSAESEAAVAFALRLALGLGSRILAVYVVDTSAMDYLQQMKIFISEERNELEASIGAKGKAYLARAQNLAKAVNVPLETQLLRGRLHREVLNLARQRAVDAIVIGGRKGLYRDKDLSTVEREILLDQATIPVLVIK
jgi:nucleotide-binding universal stress UspA family protein